MKRALIVAMIILGYAVPASLLFAQAGQEPSKAPSVEDPAAQPAPASPAEATPAEQAAPQQPTEPQAATPAPAAQPETAPAEQAAPQQPAAPAPTPAAKAEPAPSPASGKTNHREYAGMELKECAACHKGEGIAPTHGAGWSKEHRLPASRSSKNCADCHSQQSCLDCHTGGGINADLSVENVKMNYAPHSHRTDFIEIHPIKAIDNPQTCYRCHAAKFCSDCHAKYKREDLMVKSHRRSWSDLQLSSVGPKHSLFTTTQCQTCHPGGVLPSHTWSSDHAREARRNLQSCQTCHSDGTICQTCHSSRRGLMINPHPRNWNAVKDKYRSKSGGRSCIVCHDTY